MAAKLLSPAEANTQLQTAAQVLQSNTIALEVMQQLHMTERSDFAGRCATGWKYSTGSAASGSAQPSAGTISAGAEVDVVPKTDIVSVRFKARNAELAAAAMNAVISSYTERKIRTSYDSATQVSDWLSGQMDDLKTKASESQERLAELQRTTGLIGATKRATSLRTS